MEFFHIWGYLFRIFRVFDIIYIWRYKYILEFDFSKIVVFWILLFRFFFVLYPSAVSSAARLLSPSAIYHLPSITRRLLTCLYQFLSIDFFISTRFYQIISVICYLYQFLSIKLFESFIAMNLSYQFISINFYQFNFINLFLLIYLY
jgi:hypothetical protein